MVVQKKWVAIVVSSLLTLATVVWVFSDNAQNLGLQKNSLAEIETPSDSEEVNHQAVPTESNTGAEKPAPRKPDRESVASIASKPDFDADAIRSFSDSLRHGDERAPSVAEYQPRVLPSAAERNDPERYQSYEARQEEQLKLAFVIAAEDKITTMEAAIERAKAEGLDKEQLDEGIRKLEGIRAMKQQLEQEMGIDKNGGNPNP